MVKLLWDDIFRACSGSDHASAVSLATFPSDPVVAATACVVPFLLDPAAALGRMSPWHMKLRCLDLRSVSTWRVVCGVHPPAPERVHVVTLSPACLVLRPCVVAPPSVRVRFCPGALACACSCFARVRPCAQGHCGRCPHGSGVMSDLFFLCVLADMLGQGLCSTYYILVYDV